MSDDLNHIIRSAFEENSSESAPNSLWSAIDTELTENEIDVTIKDSFESQQSAAPEMVWERVQNQLDIDRVWIRIAGKIRIKKYAYVLRYACAAIILMLPFALDYDFNTSEINVNQNAVSPPIAVGKSVVISLEDSLVIESNSFKAPRIIQAVADRNNQIINAEPLPTPVDTNIVDEKMDFDDYIAMRPMASIAQSERLQLKTKLSLKPKRSIGLIVGAVSSLDNTWIIDNDTRTGFDSESLVDNQISLGSSFGAFAEYQLNRRYSIFAEYLFQSRSRQHQDIFDNEGFYTHKEREVNSYKFALMVTRYTQPKFHGVSHRTLFRFGGYYSGVKSDLTYTDQIVTSVNSIYKRHDVGLRMEIGQRVYLKSFILEGGIKSEYGLANLASDKSEIPPHLNFTRFVSGGLYLKAAYSF